MTPTPTRPVLRYHGGKWRIAPRILAHFPPHRTYVEPFGGAASVLLRKPRAYAEAYNDLDGEIVNVFRVLRDPALAAELRRAVELTPFARAEFRDAYLPSDDPVERARRILVRSWMGHGSTGCLSKASAARTGFRADIDRRGTCPAVDWGRWPAQVPAFVERLRGVVIECEPAERVIRRYDRPDALFYVDPPYPMHTRTSYRDGHRYRHELSMEGHRELAEALRAAAGMVVFSGYACDLYDRELYPDWTRVELPTHADRARPRVEVLWISPAAARALDAGNRTLF